MKGRFEASADSKENDKAYDKREDAHQVHSPDDFRIHQRLGRKAAFPLLLIVMVQRRAQKEALSRARAEPRKLEVADLQKNGTGFGDDDGANYREEKPGLDQDEHDADARPESHRPGVAHVDFRGRAVEPEVGEKRPGDGHRERKELVAPRKKRHVQVVAENEVSAHVGDDAHKNHAAENRDRNEAVEPVRKVGAVGRGRNDKGHEPDKGPVRKVNLEHIDGDKGDCQVPAQIRNELVAENGDDKAEEEIETEPDGTGNAVGLFHIGGGFRLALRNEPLGLDLCEIVDGADRAERDEDEQRGNGVAVQLARQKRDDDDHRDEQDPAHDGGRLCLGICVKVRSRVRLLQKADVGGHGRKHKHDGEHRGEARAEKATVKKGKFGQLIYPFAEHTENLVNSQACMGSWSSKGLDPQRNADKIKCARIDFVQTLRIRKFCRSQLRSVVLYSWSRPRVQASPEHFSFF